MLVSVPAMLAADRRQHPHAIGDFDADLRTEEPIKTLLPRQKSTCRAVCGSRKIAARFTVHDDAATGAEIGHDGVVQDGKQQRA
mgnify:CR=1 FL=1